MCAVEDPPARVEQGELVRSLGVEDREACDEAEGRLVRFVLGRVEEVLPAVALRRGASQRLARGGLSEEDGADAQSARA